MKFQEKMEMNRIKDIHARLKSNDARDWACLRDGFQVEKSKILDVKPISTSTRYFCSENSSATLLFYYNQKISPMELNRQGCIDFLTILPCLGKDFTMFIGESSTLKKYIDANHPVIVSIIPDSNILEEERHSIVIIGYVEKERIIDSLVSIDDGKIIQRNYEKFYREWKRAGCYLIGKRL
jgi:hypothetical protein